MLIVKDYGNYFLRDDTEIRKDCEWISEDSKEGYSLFVRSPEYHRVEVFVGSKKWAIQEADKAVEAKLT